LRREEEEDDDDDEDEDGKEDKDEFVATAGPFPVALFIKEDMCVAIRSILPSLASAETYNLTQSGSCWMN
jgi:hypothetical protein